jgi:hypothetical protein
MALWKLEHQPGLCCPCCGCASAAAATSRCAAIAAAASRSSSGCAVARAVVAIAADACGVHPESAGANAHHAAVLLRQASDDFQQGRLALYIITAAHLGSDQALCLDKG